MAAGLATLAEIDDAGLVERSAVLGRRLLELTEPLCERHEVVKEVRGLGLMWAIEFKEPDSRGRSYRLVERIQHGLFAQLVVVPLFKEHRVLIQVAGHGIPVVKGLPAARRHRGRACGLRRGARRLDREGRPAPTCDGRVRAHRGGSPLTTVAGSVLCGRRNRL